MSIIHIFAYGEKNTSSQSNYHHDHHQWISSYSNNSIETKDWTQKWLNSVNSEMTEFSEFKNDWIQSFENFMMEISHMQCMNYMLGL